MFERQTKKTIKHIHEGKYAANVEITHHYDGSGWEPTIDVEDVRKLERVRAALAEISGQGLPVADKRDFAQGDAGGDEAVSATRLAPRPAPPSPHPPRLL
jgi:hypothetical protein